MRILFVLGLEVNPNLGGVERVTHILTNYFKSKEIKIAFIYFRQNSIAFPEFNQNIDTYFLPDLINIRAKENIVYFRNILLQNKIDIVINQGNIADEVSVLIAECVDGTLAQTVSVLHNTPFRFFQFYGQFKQTQLNEFHAGKKSIRSILKIKLVKLIALRDYHYRYKKYLKLSVESGARFVLLSKGYIPILNKILNNKNYNNVIAIPNPASFIENFNVNDIAAKKKKVIYVGRLDKNQKRVDRLLDAWKIIETDFPDWELIIIGGNLNANSDTEGDYQSNEMSRLKLLCTKLSLKNVVFTGNINPVPFYKDACIIGLTSNYEGFPMVLVEAIQYGVVPVVFGSFEAVFDLIENNKNGVIVKPFDINDFAKSLKYLMQHNEKRQEMAINALATSKQYTIETIGDMWIKTFREIKDN